MCGCVGVCVVKAFSADVCAHTQSRKPRALFRDAPAMLFFSLRDNARIRVCDTVYFEGVFRSGNEGAFIYFCHLHTVHLTAQMCVVH